MNPDNVACFAEDLTDVGRSVVERVTGCRQDVPVLMKRQPSEWIRPRRSASGYCSRSLRCQPTRRIGRGASEPVANRGAGHRHEARHFCGRSTLLGESQSVVDLVTSVHLNRTDVRIHLGRNGVPARDERARLSLAAAVAELADAIASGAIGRTLVGVRVPPAAPRLRGLPATCARPAGSPRRSARRDPPEGSVRRPRSLPARRRSG